MALVVNYLNFSWLFMIVNNDPFFFMTVNDDPSLTTFWIQNTFFVGKSIDQKSVDQKSIDQKSLMSENIYVYMYITLYGKKTKLKGRCKITNLRGRCYEKSWYSIYTRVDPYPNIYKDIYYSYIIYITRNSRRFAPFFLDF